MESVTSGTPRRSIRRWVVGVGALAVAGAVFAILVLLPSSGGPPSNYQPLVHGRGYDIVGISLRGDKLTPAELAQNRLIGANKSMNEYRIPSMPFQAEISIPIRNTGKFAVTIQHVSPVSGVLPGLLYVKSLIILTRAPWGEVFHPISLDAGVEMSFVLDIHYRCVSLSSNGPTPTFSSIDFEYVSNGVVRTVAIKLKTSLVLAGPSTCTDVNLSRAA